MNIDEMLEISDCPLCDGGALLEEECGCSYYVSCLDCGCHTVNIDFCSDEERLDAAKRAVMLWNTGKVISSSPGEGEAARECPYEPFLKSFHTIK